MRSSLRRSRSAVACLDLREADVVVDDVRPGGLHRREGVVRGVRTGRSRDEAHLGEFGVEDAVDLPRDAGRILDREVLLEPDGGGDAAVVRRREELGGHLRNEPQREDEEPHHREDRDAAVADDPAERPRIGGIEPRQCPVDGLVDDAQPPVVVHAALAAEQVGRHHRRERDGRGRRDADDDRDDPAQLAEEDARHAGDHRQRHEDRDDDERRGDDREPHLVGGVDGGLLRVRAALDMRRNVLQNHDGVVDHHTDGDGERTERDDVDGTARQIEVDEAGE